MVEWKQTQNALSVALRFIEKSLDRLASAITHARENIKSSQDPLPLNGFDPNMSMKDSTVLRSPHLSTEILRVFGTGSLEAESQRGLADRTRGSYLNRDRLVRLRGNGIPLKHENLFGKEASKMVAYLTGKTANIILKASVDQIPPIGRAALHPKGRLSTVRRNGLMLVRRYGIGLTLSVNDADSIIEQLTDLRWHSQSITFGALQ